MAKQDDIDKIIKDDNLSPVTLPSGGLFYVHDREVAYFNERCKRYLSDNHFTNISDLQDIDRMIIAELLVQRWGTWVSQGRDWYGDPVNTQELQKSMREHSMELRLLKKALGIDKETRDKVRGEDSVDAYIKSLRQRAKEFGYMRNAQAAKSIELMQELIAKLTLWENCDDQEKIQQHCTTDQIMDWIIGHLRPEFEKIDKDFRTGTQQYWIRKQ